MDDRFFRSAEGIGQEQSNRVVRLRETGVKTERCFEFRQRAAHLARLLSVHPKVVVNLGAPLLLFRRHVTTPKAEE